MTELMTQLHKPNVHIFGYNTNPENLTAVRSRSNTAVLDEPAQWEGWLVSDALLQFWTKKTPISAATEEARYPWVYQWVTRSNLPPNVKNYPFRDIGKNLVAAWKKQGYQIKALTAPTVSVSK
jgi:ABC-type sugar transport system substrate-binding protein